MLVLCDNKGCLKNTEAKLDTETKDVLCAECLQPIKNVSDTMKRVLKSVGQIVRDDIRKAFTIACLQCMANREVVLNTKNETVCAVCRSGITVHAAMRLAMEETGTKLRKLTAEEENQETKKTRKKKSKEK